MKRSTLNAMPIRTGVSFALAAAVTAVSLLAAGCSTGGYAPLARVTISADIALSAPPSPMRLTMAQARTEYSQISAPFNAAVATVNADARDGTTWNKFRADVLTVVAANETWDEKIRAVRWPLQIQPYVDAMLKTEVPSEIQCDQAMAAAGSLQGASGVFSSDHACRDSTVNADKIRKLLNLPPTIG